MLRNKFSLTFCAIVFFLGLACGMAWAENLTYFENLYPLGLDQSAFLKYGGVNR